jgi:hypothetical protein
MCDAMWTSTVAFKCNCGKCVELRNRGPRPTKTYVVSASKTEMNSLLCQPLSPFSSSLVHEAKYSCRKIAEMIVVTPIHSSTPVKAQIRKVAGTSGLVD